MTSLFYGLIPSGNINDVLSRILRFCSNDCSLVVRSIDSGTSQDDIVKSLNIHNVPYQVLNGNVCVSPNGIPDVVSTGLFTGFDEIWIISGKPPASELSSLSSATSDGVDFSLGLPDDLAKAIQETNCLLILGDGCGLNFVTSSPQLLQMLPQGQKTRTKVWRG